MWKIWQAFVFPRVQRVNDIYLVKRELVHNLLSGEVTQRSLNLLIHSGCENGECSGNRCVCNKGYRLDSTGKFCTPVCSPPCSKGNCTEPNVCSCNRGYDLTSDGGCLPKCTNPCEFGQCVAPEKCACPSGFILNRNSVCSPVCEK